MTIDWVMLQNLFQTFIVPVAVYGVAVSRGIRNEMRTLNGRLITMEQWKRDHEKPEVSAHSAINGRLKRLETRADGA